MTIRQLLGSTWWGRRLPKKSKYKPLDNVSKEDVERSFEIQSIIAGTLAHHKFYQGSTLGKYDLESKSFAEAVRRFQLLYRIEPSGELNDLTLEFMRRGRCVHLRFDEVFRFDHDKPKSYAMHDVKNLCSWPGPQINYGLGLPSVNFSESFQEVKKAIDMWNSLKRIEFVPTGTGQDPDVVVGWTTPKLDTDNFGFPGDAVAHAELPGGCSEKIKDLPKPVHFNDGKKWGKTSNFVVKAVALHELGHILGFRDVDDEKSVMYHTFAEGDQRNLCAADKDAFHQLYKNIPLRP